MFIDFFWSIISLSHVKTVSISQLRNGPTYAAGQGRLQARNQ